MYRSWKVLLVATLGALLLLSAACDQASVAQLQGVLQNVDSLSGKATIKFNDGSTTTIDLKDVQIETLRQAVGSASLEAGSQVTVEMDKDKKVKTLKVHAAEAEGVIKSVDEAKRTITISQDEDGEVTLNVTENTKIEASGGATFAALRYGQEVEAKYDVETKNALKIEIQDEEPKGELKGAITAIDVNAKTVTIRAKNGIETTFKMTSQTELRGVLTFADVKVGMMVEVKFNEVTKELARLKVKEENAKGELEGTITAIDANTKTITIRAKNGKDATVKVVAGTLLEGVGAFGELRSGMMVHARFNETNKELFRLKVQREEVKAELEGTITAIDTNTKTVTIRAKNGIETTFKVTAQTELRGVVAFGDLKVGMMVEVKFDEATKELSRLEVANKAPGAKP